MMKYLLMMTLLSFSLTNIVSQNHSNKEIIEKAFKKWNEKTLGSINEQITLTKNPQIKSTLTTVLDVLKIGLYSKTGNEKGMVDKGMPSRYKFLQTIFTKHQISEHFYIVETVIEGEVVQIRNFLVEKNINGSQVIGYSYYNGSWVKVSDTILVNVDLHNELINNKDKLLGNNYSGVILSEFNALNIICHYYIPSSIKRDNDVLKILSL